MWRRQLFGVSLTCFLDAIRHEISGKARSLVEKTYRNVVSARSLTQKVLEKSKAFHSRSPVRSDAKVLIGVIKHEISEYEKKKKHWRIDERGAIQIVSDYLAIRDYNLGEHREIMGGLLKNFGIDFLPDSDKPEYKTSAIRPEEKHNIFMGKGYADIGTAMVLYDILMQDFTRR